MTRPALTGPDTDRWQERLLRCQNALNDEYHGYVVRVHNPPRRGGTRITAVEMRSGQRRVNEVNVIVAGRSPQRELSHALRWFRWLMGNAPAWSIKTDYEDGALLVYGRRWYQGVRPVVRVDQCTLARARQELTLLALAGEPER